MDIQIGDLMAQIGEQSVELRAVNMALNNAVARINFLETICQRHGIDLEAEAEIIKQENEATTAALVGAVNGNGGERRR